MPGLKDILKKRDKLGNEAQTAPSQPAPEFTFIRSTTQFQEVIEPPVHPDDDDAQPRSSKDKRRSLNFRGLVRSSSSKEPSSAAQESSQQLPVRPRGERRLSARLHLHRRDASRSGFAEPSSNLPQDLPEAPEVATVHAKDKAATDESAAQATKEQEEQREAQWEKRATMLAMSSPFRDQEQSSSIARSRSPSISDAKGDVNIQEAIRLHEEGKLTESTEMFGTLAQSKGANNALAQVLYGLALRHGWGIPVNPEKAIHYLSLAASNSASIEEQALASGMKKGGSAKGELVLAIFELANCFRNGWGVKKDSVAARQYYETAANLGDTDAMAEAAWCYLEGFGGPKDKFKAAQYLRLAEEKGSKGVGQSWIWKEKYNPQ